MTTEKVQKAEGLSDIFGEVIHAYTRAQAIEDGELVDVSRIAEEAGFTVPVAVTRRVWNKYIVPAAELVGQSETGRLWDALFILRMAIKGAIPSRDITPAAEHSSHIMLYEVIFQMPDKGDWEPKYEKPTVIDEGARPNRAVRTVTLKAHSGAGDNGEHVITILQPEED